MAQYKYRINSTAGKKGDAVTQTGDHLRQLIDAGIVYETKVVKPETKQEKPKQEKPAPTKPKKKGGKK